MFEDEGTMFLWKVGHQSPSDLESYLGKTPCPKGHFSQVASRHSRSENLVLCSLKVTSVLQKPTTKFLELFETISYSIYFNTSNFNILHLLLGLFMKIFEYISCFPFCHLTYPQGQWIKSGNSVKCMAEESLEKSGIHESKRNCYWTIVTHLLH